MASWPPRLLCPSAPSPLFEILARSKLWPIRPAHLEWFTCQAIACWPGWVRSARWLTGLRPGFGPAPLWEPNWTSVKSGMRGQGPLQHPWQPAVNKSRVSTCPSQSLTRTLSFLGVFQCWHCWACCIIAHSVVVGTEKHISLPQSLP